MADSQLQQDTFKAFCALRNGMSLVRIHQADVCGGKWPTWQTQLKAAITKALETEEPFVTYLARDVSVYDKHKESLAKALDDGRALYTGTESDSEDA
jgi:hypothetical protein